MIHKLYPDWPFEEGFAEEDPLWDAVMRETDEAMDRRLRQGLDEIFGSDDNTWISISTHSGKKKSTIYYITKYNCSNSPNRCNCGDSKR